MNAEKYRTLEFIHDVLTNKDVDKLAASCGFEVAFLHSWRKGVFESLLEVHRDLDEEQAREGTNVLIDANGIQMWNNTKATEAMMARIEGTMTWEQAERHAGFSRASLLNFQNVLIKAFLQEIYEILNESPYIQLPDLLRRVAA